MGPVGPGVRAGLKNTYCLARRNGHYVRLFAYMPIRRSAGRKRQDRGRNEGKGPPARARLRTKTLLGTAGANLWAA